MASGKYISDEELMIIRIGTAHGISQVRIAEYLGRGRVAVARHVAKMKKNGTIGELPIPFIEEPIAEALRQVKR